MGISAERGVEAAKFIDGFFNKIKFSRFLQELASLGGRRPAVFLDNGPWHIAHHTKDTADLLQLELIFNDPAELDLNF